MQLIPVLGKTLDLAILNLKDGCRTPFGFIASLFNAFVRLTTVATLSCVSQQHMSIFRKHLIVTNNVQVCDTGHNMNDSLHILAKT